MTQEEWLKINKPNYEVEIEPKSGLLGNSKTEVLSQPTQEFHASLYHRRGGRIGRMAKRRARKAGRA